MKRFVGAFCLTALLSGCATWSTSSVDASGAAPTAATTQVKRAPADIRVLETDVVDRQYQALGDITARVNKTTIFNANPTREMVNVKLQEQASELGADAVILVRYGEGGVSLMSWGSLEGKGRAIKFTP